MKNLVLGMLAMAAMVSCSSENDPIDDVTGGKQDKVEIKLNAGVVGVETKAVVTEWNDTQVSFAVKGAATYEANVWYAQIASTNAVTFIKSLEDTSADPKYYNTDGTNTTLVGFYPASNITDGKVSFTIPEIGDTDIMATGEFSGSKTTAFNNENIKFSHLLSKIAFKVQKKDGYTGNTTIKNITLKGTKRSLTLALPSTVTFTNNAGGDDITVLNTSITLDGTEQDAGTVMVEPGATMTVDVTVGDSSTPTFVDIPVNITGNANTVAGQAYAITLSFSGKAVESLEATITGWGTETTGSGDIY